MDSINRVVSANLKRLREGRKLSLDALSRLTGVSKSMLGQIERGEVNPTISTVWKVANGLKISFTALTARPDGDFEVVGPADLEPLTGDDGKYLNYPVFPYEAERGFEIYRIEMKPGACMEAEPHPEGSQEFVTVFSGELALTVDGTELFLPAEASARFRADRPHRYRNAGGKSCRMSMVIWYPG